MFEIYGKNIQFGLSDNSRVWIIYTSSSPTQLTYSIASPDDFSEDFYDPRIAQLFTDWEG